MNESFTYRIDTKVIDNDVLHQTVTKSSPIFPADHVTHYIYRIRDVQIQEALKKLGFMQWTHVSKGLPEQDEMVLFLYGDIHKNNVCYGFLGPDGWVDERHSVPCDEIEWWCRICLPAPREGETG